MIFSGNGVCRFAVYNFALHTEDLIKEFENEVCSIAVCYYLCSSIPEIVDKPTQFLYSIGKVKVLNTSKLLQTGFTTQIQEVEDVQKTWALLVVGPAQSGKTTVAKFLAESNGFVLLDYSAIIDETKAFLSTEEDQRDSVSFSELIQGIERFFVRNPGKPVVLDGFPSNEILYGADSKYPNYPSIPSEEEGYLIEEDIHTDKKIKLAASRLSDFISHLRILLKVQLEAPVEVVINRLKTKLETPAEEGLSADATRELLES